MYSEESPTPAPSVKTFRIHLLVKTDAGPIQSRRGGTAFTIGTDSRWRFACDQGGELVLDELNRGTPEADAVRCKACRETEEYKKAPRPRSSTGPGMTDLVSES